VTPCTYVWSWGSGLNADTFTLNIIGNAPGVPESGSTGSAMLLALGALAFVGRCSQRLRQA
ncbi:MAG: hypothetical protein ACREFG_05250, partial [Chthoniobacterales bacterium]